MQRTIQHITGAFLALIILLRMMAMPISLIDYTINKRYISQHLCENRFRSVATCLGKCYLHKQLTKSSESHPGTDQKGGIKILLIDFYENLDKPSLGITGLQNLQHLPFRDQLLIVRSLENIFHPPAIGTFWKPQPC